MNTPAKITATITLSLTALTGCAGEDPEPAPTVTITQTPEPAAEPVAPARDQGTQDYLDTVEDVAPVYWATHDETNVIMFGRTVCDALDNGLDIYDVILALPSEMADGEGGSITGAAVLYLCPEHEADVRADMGA